MSDIRQNRIELNEVHIARSLAIFLVVMLHASGAYFLAFSDSWNTITTYSSFTRQCIGLFFIITGYLYYKKEIEASNHLAKGVRKLFIPFMFWWLFYFLYNNHYNGLKISSLFQHSEVHLWFMYTYICMYIFLPIISNPLKNLPSYYILMIIAMLFYVHSLVPYIHRTMFSLTWLKLDFISENGIYILVGAILRRYRDRISTISWIIYFLLVVFFSMATVLATIWWSSKVGRPEQLFFKNTAPFVFASAIFTFMFCISVKDRVSDHVLSFIRTISGLSFGIYFIHFIFVREIKFGYSPVNAWYMIPVLTIIYFAISALICYLLSKNKITKHLI